MASRGIKAFTLLELMITVAVIAILLTLGVPSFAKFSQKQAISAAIHSLHSDLLLARSQAIYRDVQVVACPGNERTGCADSNEWDDGWIVFADSNADRERQEGEDLLRSGMGIEQMAILSSNGRRSLRFYPDGSAPGSNGSISFCGPGGPEQARKLVISNLGRIRREPAPALPRSMCP